MREWFSQTSHTPSFATLLNNTCYVCRFIFYKKKMRRMNANTHAVFTCHCQQTCFFKTFANMAPSQMVREAMRLQSEKGNGTQAKCLH